MALIDLSALRAAFRFPVQHARLVLLGAGLYAAVFFFQSYFTAAATGAETPGYAAPLAFTFALAAFIAFIVALAAWLRADLGHALGSGLDAFRFSDDERRLLWGVVLVLILLFTVMGTALLMLAFMLGALAILGAQRSGLMEPPEGFINIFELFALGEWIVAIVLIAAFAGFNIWFFARLALAAPATIARSQVQVLAAWPLSDGRVSRIVLTTLAATLPGLAILVAFNMICAALFGVYPASSLSMTDAQGSVTVSDWSFAALSLPYGVLKMAVLAAPLTALFSALYRRAGGAATKAG